MSEKVRLAIHGRGRMGAALHRLIRPSASLMLICELDQDQVVYRDGTETDGHDRQSALKQVDGVIDFTLPNGTRQLVQELQSLERPPFLISGTTGLEPGDMEQLKALSKQTAVMWEPNFSLGVVALRWLAAQAGQILSRSRGFDVHVHEQHHRRKKDAPSGTARSLAEAVVSSSDRTEWSSESNLGSDEVDAVLRVTAERLGDIVGTHRVSFGSDQEVVSLSHSALTRDVFAAGALSAAAWLESLASPGLYSLADMLGLETRSDR